MPVPVGATRLKPFPVVDVEVIVVLFLVTEEEVPGEEETPEEEEMLEEVDDETSRTFPEGSVELLPLEVTEELPDVPDADFDIDGVV